MDDMMVEDRIRLAAMLLSHMSEAEAAEQLTSTGVSTEDAFLAVKAAVVLRQPSCHVRRELGAVAHRPEKTTTTIHTQEPDGQEEH